MSDDRSDNPCPLCGGTDMHKCPSPHRKAWSWPLPNCVVWEIPRLDKPGAFGVRRHMSRHTGLDIYAPEGWPVHAMEDGIVVRVENFTGITANPPSPWWLETRAILVEGESGVITYGEVQEEPWVVAGATVKQGQRIGKVVCVLPVDKGNGRSMLHIELYRKGWRGPTVTRWDRDEEGFPEGLCDPTFNLMGAWLRVTHRFHRDAPPVPATVEARKKEIAWLQGHPVWLYPWTHRVPPGGHTEETAFAEADETWVDETTLSGGSLQECLDFDFVYVDPTKERIVGPKFSGWLGIPENNEFRVWIEAGGWMDRQAEPDPIEPPGGWNAVNRWQRCHDMDLDCGGATMEDALLQLAARVRFYYGDYDEDSWKRGTLWPKRDVPEDCGGEFENGDTIDGEYIDHCEDAGDGFCKKCGYLMSRPKDEQAEEEAENA